jgi:hypothetical protein
MAKRRRREYLQLLDAAKVAFEVGIDAFNCVWHPYRHPTTLMLLSNGWELFAKAVLLHAKESILRGHRGETISAEVAVHRLTLKRLLDQDQADTVQQLISLRNAACHGVLPDVPPEVMQHLLFYSMKFYRTILARVFPGHIKELSDNYLSLSFGDLTTYADKVQRAVARVKKSDTTKSWFGYLSGASASTERATSPRHSSNRNIVVRSGCFHISGSAVS